MFCGGSYIHTTVGSIGYILPATLVSRSAPTNTTSSSATQMARPQPVGCSESQLSWWSNPWARALLFIWGQNLPGSRDSLHLQRPWQLMVGERQLKNTWLELSEVCIHLWLPVVNSRLTFRLLACWILNTGEIVMFLRRRDMKHHEKLDTPIPPKRESFSQRWAQVIAWAWWVPGDVMADPMEGTTPSLLAMPMTGRLKPTGTAFSYVRLQGWLTSCRDLAAKFPLTGSFFQSGDCDRDEQRWQVPQIILKPIRYVGLSEKKYVGAPEFDG